jgi:hypothetical protein
MVKGPWLTPSFLLPFQRGRPSGKKVVHFPCGFPFFISPSKETLPSLVNPTVSD